jgi:hypothetical protein
VTINLVGIITCKRREKIMSYGIMKTHCSKIINFATDKTPFSVKYFHVLGFVTINGGLDYWI